MEARVALLEQETPHLSLCAYIELHKESYQTITYDSLFHLSTNIKEGGLDSCTGKFLCGLSGTYSVSWNYFSGSRSVVLKKE